MENRNNTKKESAPQKPTISKFQKAFMRGESWTKTELLDVMHWFKQVFGLLFGILFGILGMTGFIGLSTYFISIATLAYMYYYKFLGVDEDDEIRFDLIQEGLFTSFGVFLVSWIVLYNIVHVS